jgi:MYXO-CTERM domain-containing protein
VAFFGFPLETIASEADRLEMFSRLLPALVTDYTPPEDTGFTDTGDADTGGEEGKPRACGCATSGSSGNTGLLALFALGWLRVRSRPRRAIL